MCHFHTDSFWYKQKKVVEHRINANVTYAHAGYFKYHRIQGKQISMSQLLYGTILLLFFAIKSTQGMFNCSVLYTRSYTLRQC